MSTIIKSFWISGPLQPVNLLTIRSFIDNGHPLIIFTYEPDRFLGEQCSELKIIDANTILPASEIFYYKNIRGGDPKFKFGGIAERFKSEMLYQLGGWVIDLDIACLKNFDELGRELILSQGKFPSGDLGAYVFRPHEKGVVANIVKAPAGSEFARLLLEHTKTITPDNRDYEKSFKALYPIVKQLGIEKYILPESVFGNDNEKYWKIYLQNNGQIPPPEMFAIHWCGAMGAGYQLGSFYDKLLVKYYI